jgi:nitrogen regulatory protein PII
MEKKKLDAPVKLKVLVTIVNRKKADFYTSILEGFDVTQSEVVYGQGLASKQILAYLGLSKTDKAVIISVVKENKIKEILSSYEEKYFKIKDGNGIAFTIPLTQMIGINAYKYLCNMEE